MTLPKPTVQIATRDGWSRCWKAGQPHYFVKGSQDALCGAPAGLLRGDPVTDHVLTLTEYPDDEITSESRKKAPCGHCVRKVKLMNKGRRR